MNPMLIVLIVAIIVAINSISSELCVRVRAINHRPIINLIRESKNGKMVYLLGGMTCRTEHVFDFILSDIPEKTGVCHLDYQNLGLDFNYAVKLLKEFVKSHPADNTFVSISMGYLFSKAVARASDKQVALNPCIGYYGLRKGFQDKAWLMPWAKTAVFLLGWLAYLPVIKVSHGQRYSIALLIDQLDICSSDDYPIGAGDLDPDVLVLSLQDGVIDNLALLSVVNSKTVHHCIDTTHFGVTDNSKMYREFVLPYL